MLKIAGKTRMKFALLLSLCFFFCGLSLESFAVGTAEAQAVFDEAALFTQDDAALLEEQADLFTSETGIDMMIITTNDNQGKESRLYAADFYEAQGYSDQDPAILLAIDMQGREVAVVSSAASLEYFPVSVTDEMLENVQTYLKEDDALSAASVFIEDAQYTVANYGVKPAGRIFLVSLGVAVVIAGIVSAVLFFTHNSLPSSADFTRDYLTRSNALTLTKTKDRFLTTNTVRTAIPKSDNNSSGGSVSSSSGGSYSGSSGKF